MAEQASKPGKGSQDPRQQQLERDFDLVVAGVFRGPAGKKVIEWLRASYTNTILGPEASDAALRYREGQRSVVAALMTRIEQGERG